MTLLIDEIVLSTCSNVAVGIMLVRLPYLLFLLETDHFLVYLGAISAGLLQALVSIRASQTANFIVSIFQVHHTLPIRSSKVS